MIAFEIYVNGKRLCTAGIGEVGVLAANLLWVGSEPQKGARNKTAKMDEYASIRVGGLFSKTEEHVKWARRNLRRGDEVAIRIIETVHVDPPREIEKRTAATIRSRQKRQVRSLAKKFGWKIQTK
jgi:hypothetical protein